MPVVCLSILENEQDQPCSDQEASGTEDQDLDEDGFQEYLLVSSSEGKSDSEDTTTCSLAPCQY